MDAHNFKLGLSSNSYACVESLLIFMFQSLCNMKEERDPCMRTILTFNLNLNSNSHTCVELLLVFTFQRYNHHVLKNDKSSNVAMSELPVRCYLSG